MGPGIEDAFLLPPPEADAALDRLWEGSTAPERQRLVLAVVRQGLATHLSVERAMVWSARLRTFGLARSCPLLAQAAEQGRLPSARILAAATAHRAFGDPRGRSLFAAAAEALVGREQRPPVRSNISLLAPDLLADLDAIWSRSDPPSGLDPGPWAYLASIVIAIRDQSLLGLSCLEHVAEVTGPLDYEIVLVDDGSTDATPQLCASLQGDVQVIRNEKSEGNARACNQGAAAARGKTLVFLDSATEPFPRWLESLLAVLAEDPDVGMVGGRLLTGPEAAERAAERDVGKRADVEAVGVECAAVRREAFDAVGGFDEHCGDENFAADLCAKVSQAGWRIVAEPAVVVLTAAH